MTTEVELLNEPKKQEFQLYSRRFLVAFSVFLGNLSNSALWTTYSAVTPSASEYYGASSFMINILALVFLILYIPLSPVASWCLDVKGLRISIILGCWLTAVGAGVRWAGCYLESPTSRYAITLLGQCLASIAQPFLLDAPSVVTAYWFGEKERTTTNTVISLGQPIGSAILLLVGPSIIGTNPANFATLNLVVFILAGVCALPSLWILDRPPTAPTFSAQVTHVPFKQGVFQLFKIKAYVILWIVFGTFLGIFNTFVTLISDYVVPFGYTQDQAGNLGVIAIGVGLVNAGIIGVVLDRTHGHAIAVKICCLIVTLGTIVFLLGMKSSNQYSVLAIASAMFGMGGFPLIPVVLEAAVEVTFPISPGTSAGFLMWGGQIFGIILLLISNAVRGSDGNLYYGMVLMITCSAACLVVSFFFQSDNRRNRADRTSFFAEQTTLSDVSIRVSPE
ncbi:hypothetical protein BDV3_006245 [Batrachochytrium dendrobatidis]|uniref:Major facilitator superfamily (MFS) profile domain-containing protein n=1 Tax=Batrachochytrium dendrobatidis (strain JEL423) TaxID=403673 RepID=A0A177WPE0_BATDL|nr:hypothetical protein BDEG_25505 [Batrachochytrium dendrobatidis JEL423]